MLPPVGPHQAAPGKCRLMEHLYLKEFFLMAAVHLVAMASPGPDFAIVVRQSVGYGRKVATWTSIGIGAGILLHVAYSLLGIGVLIAHSIVLFSVLKIAGACYLVFIGIKALRARPAPPGESVGGEFVRTMPAGRAFRTGFLTNALNPKVTLFFLSLFTVVIRPETPVPVQAGYGLYMSVSTMLWFSMLSQVLGNGAVRGSFHRFGHWVERVTGVLLIALGLRLAFSKMQG